MYVREFQLQNGQIMTNVQTHGWVKYNEHDYKLVTGDSVLYVPLHAHNDINHRDCEYGVVSSYSLLSTHIFVKYRNNDNGKLTPKSLLFVRDLDK